MIYKNFIDIEYINEYYNWVLNKRGYLYENEIGTILSDKKYSYKNFIKEKHPYENEEDK